MTSNHDEIEPFPQITSDPLPLKELEFWKKVMPGRDPPETICQYMGNHPTHRRHYESDCLETCEKDCICGCDEENCVDPTHWHLSGDIFKIISGVNEELLGAPR